MGVVWKGKHGRGLTSRNPVAEINTMNASARSSTYSSSFWLAWMPPTAAPTPAVFLSTWTTSALWSPRKRRAGTSAAVLCGPLVSTAAPIRRATRTRRE